MVLCIRFLVFLSRLGINKEVELKYLLIVVVDPVIKSGNDLIGPLLVEGREGNIRMLFPKIPCS